MRANDGKGRRVGGEDTTNEMNRYFFGEQKSYLHNLKMKGIWERAGKVEAWAQFVLWILLTGTALTILVIHFAGIGEYIQKLKTVF